MPEIFREARHTARKTYTCNACEWVSNGETWREHSLTYAELREIAKARRNQWKIVPGQEYIKWVGIEYGEFMVWRGIPAIDAICHKYNVYDEQGGR